MGQAGHGVGQGQGKLTRGHEDGTDQDGAALTEEGVGQPASDDRGDVDQTGIDAVQLEGVGLGPAHATVGGQVGQIQGVDLITLILAGHAGLQGQALAIEGPVGLGVLAREGELAQVAQVDLKLVNNAFGLRLLLEREAAQRFCTSVSDADLAAIEGAHLRIVERARAGAIDDALLTDATTVDWGLHDLMVDALGNELISQTHRINMLRVRLIRLEGATLSPEALLPAMDEHLWILAALKARDVHAVGQRIAHHIDSAHRRVLGLPRPPLGGEAAALFQQALAEGFGADDDARMLSLLRLRLAPPARRG